MTSSVFLPLLAAGRTAQNTPVARMITAESETWSPAKWREIDRATRAEEEARQARARRGLPPLPVTPTHTVRCGSRDCRPGEGNLKHAMDKHGKFKQWEQPYEHREGFVQSRLRSPPHRPRPNVEYAGLVALAARLAPRGGLVPLAAGATRLHTACAEPPAGTPARDRCCSPRLAGTVNSVASHPKL